MDKIIIATDQNIFDYMREQYGEEGGDQILFGGEQPEAVVLIEKEEKDG